MSTLKISKAFVYLLLYIVLTSCSKSQPIDKAKWLIGTWEVQTSKGSIYESWQRKSDRELSGKSYLLNSGDTTVLETIQILFRSDSLFYAPTVEGQNDGMPVVFYSDIVNDTLLNFQNPDHDYPQTITYRKVREDSLVASISGRSNGRFTERFFKMRKVN